MVSLPTTWERDHSRAVLDEDDIRRAIIRISHEIIERTKGARDCVILGIPRRGSDLALRIGRHIASITGDDSIAVGILDVTDYRDDAELRTRTASAAATTIPECGIRDKTVVLVDDVFFSGRTARAALTALEEIGRPAQIQLAVLVDRGHRELPIRADYVGKNLPTSREETVVVRLRETDGADEVLIVQAVADGARVPA